MLKNFKNGLLKRIKKEIREDNKMTYKEVLKKIKTLLTWKVFKKSINHQEDDLYFTLLREQICTYGYKDCKGCQAYNPSTNKFYPLGNEIFPRFFTGSICAICSHHKNNIDIPKLAEEYFEKKLKKRNKGG